MKCLFASLCVWIGLAPGFGLALAATAHADDWNRVSREITEWRQLAQAESRQTLSLLQREKKELTGLQTGLQARVAQKQQAFDALKAQYDELLAREKNLTQELNAEEYAFKTIDGAIRTAAKQARDLFHESLTSAEFPERGPALQNLLNPDVFPGLRGVRELLRLYQEEINASGAVRFRKGEFVNSQGLRTRGEILRMGAFTAAYRLPDGETGFLRPEADGSALVAVQGNPGWRTRQAMEAYWSGQSADFPLDISNGAVFQRMKQEQKSLSDWLRTGGLLVWPIVLTGLAALLLVLERFISLGRIRVTSQRNMRAILDFVSKGEWEACERFCKQHARFPTCRVIGHTLGFRGGSRELIENAFQEGMLKELPRLERFLPTLGVLAAIAPLLGLLGTVTGMINTFQIITLYGTGDPRMLSGGISEALVTTQLGLAVAVPIMLLHHVLDRRVDRILGDMEEKGAQFSVALMRPDNEPAEESYHEAA